VGFEPERGLQLLLGQWSGRAIPSQSAVRNAAGSCPLKFSLGLAKDLGAAQSARIDLVVHEEGFGRIAWVLFHKES